MNIDFKESPYGATHYHHREGFTWWYKKKDGDIYFPSEKNSHWIKIENGRDINHDQWLEENLREIPS
jgi:hypothetical protein